MLFRIPESRPLLVNLELASLRADSLIDPKM